MVEDLERYSRSAVAQRLKEARAAKFNTAAELARTLKMKEVTVRAHENGQNGLTKSNARKYAAALGVSAEWLLFGSDRPRDFYDAVADSNRALMESSFALHDSGRVAIWQAAKVGVFQQLPEDDLSHAAGFLSMRVTGYEAIRSASAYLVADDHADRVYQPGRYIIAGPLYALDLRENDHVVVAKTLPKSNLSETTVRAARIQSGHLCFTSLATSDDPEIAIGALSQPIAPAVPGWLYPAGSRGWEPITNSSDEPVWDILGVVLADYGQRIRTGRSIAHWDRRTGRLLTDEQEVG